MKKTYTKKELDEITRGWVTLSLREIREYADMLDWATASEFQKALTTPEAMREFVDKIDWWTMSKNVFFDFKYLKEYKDKLSWYWITRSEKLTENMIVEFYDLVDWEWIAWSGKRLTKDFLKKRYEYLFGNS